VDELPLPCSVSGRLWVCGKRFVGPDPEAALDAVGAIAIVCLCELAELEDHYPGYVEWLTINQPARALWHPVPDLHAPDLGEALVLWSDLQRRLAAGEGLLVHCGAGIGRAGTVAAGLLVELGATVDDAVAHVGAHRPMAGPEVGVQRELLAQLAAHRARR